MKKTLLIALCSLAVLFAACKKEDQPEQPDPTPADYTAKYVGNYIGQFTLNIVSITMNNQQQQNSAIPPVQIDSVKMDITKGTEANTVTATVTVDNKSHQTTGTVTDEKAHFEAVQVIIDETSQLNTPYIFDLDLILDGTKVASDSLNVVGTFSGNGKATFPTPQGMQEQIIDEVSGTLSGKLVKQ